MAVFRVERTKDYTVMSNYHLKDKRLSLKAKGLLSQMLSLPEDWDYTLSGLASINLESKDAIRSAVQELEKAGYIRRRQTVDERGKFSSNEYIIYEQPQPLQDNPLSENPTTGNPSPEKPLTENPTQLNTKRTNTQKQNTDLSSTHSIPFHSEVSQATDVPHEVKRGMKRSETSVSASEIESYRELIMDNIDYDILLEDQPYEKDRLDEIVELITDTVCSTRKTIRVAGSDYPTEVIKSRFLKLNAEHIRFVFDCLKENTTKIRNIKQYLLTTLYNAPITIGNYYSALVNHDLYGESG